MRLDDPQPGFFRMRLVRGGPFVAAEIRHGYPTDPATGEELTERPVMWEALINGYRIATPSPDPVAAGVFRIWGIATPEKEHIARYIKDMNWWAEDNQAEWPDASPEKPVNPTKIPLERFRP